MYYISEEIVLYFNLYFENKNRITSAFISLSYYIFVLPRTEILKYKFNRFIKNFDKIPVFVDFIWNNTIERPDRSSLLRTPPSAATIHNQPETIRSLETP